LCQQQTGSTSVVNAFYEADRVELASGELTHHEVTAGSGGQQTICRCSACGGAVWSFYPRLGALGMGVRVGCMDDPAAFRPDGVIFASSKMAWVALPDDIPVFEESYDPSKLLPPERFERLMSLVKRAAA
jgi:hypothetical protein